TNITTSLDLMTYLEKVKPGVPVRIHAKKDGLSSVYYLNTASVPRNYFNGVLVGEIIKGSPAEAAGIETGMVIVRINDVKMYSIASFVDFMKTTQANQTLKVELIPPENYAGNINKNGTVVFDVKLSSNSVGGQQGFLGVRYGNKGTIECP